MLTKRIGFRIGVIVSVVTAAPIAWAESDGITGASGKNGSYCTNCHNDPGGTPVPTVVLEGPSQLDAGAKATYTFRITTNAAKTGMNAAMSDDLGGSLAAVDGGMTQAYDDEVTHTAPTAPTGGKSEYVFELTAPPYGGTVTLYAAGNAVDDNGDTDGDNAAKTTFEVAINGPAKPPPPPAPTATPTPAPVPVGTKDAGSGSSSSSSASPPAEEDSGCAVGSNSDTSVPAGGLLAAVLGALLLKRRRK